MGEKAAGESDESLTEGDILPRLSSIVARMIHHVSYELAVSRYNSSRGLTPMSMKKNWPALAFIIFLGILLALGGAYVELYVFR